MTWSIVSRERDSRALAIAVATKFFAVGARVPYIEPRQGRASRPRRWSIRFTGRDGLELMRDGVGAADVIRS